MTSRERRPSEGSWSVDGREERELPVDSNAEILVVGTVTVEARGAEEGNTMGGDSRPAGEETYAREELQEQSESTPQSRTQTTPLYDLSSGPSSRPTSQLQPSSAGTGFLLSAGEMPVTPNEGHVRAASAGSSVVATSHHGSIIQEGLSPPPSVTTPATAAPASFAAPSMSLMGEESSRPSFYDEEAIPSEEVTALQSIQNLIEGINAPMSRVTTPVHEGDAGPHVRGGSAASTSTQPAASSKPLGHSLPKNPNPSPPLPPAPTQSSGMKGALPFMERVEQGASSPGPVRRGSGSGAGSSNRKQQQQRAVVKGLPHQVAPELIVAITASSGVPSHATAAMDRMQHLVERGLQREPEGSHPTLGLQMQQQMLQGRTAVQTAVQGRSQSAGKEMNLNSMIIVRGLRDRGHSDMLTQPLHMGKQRTGVNSKINFGSLFGPPANTGGGTLPPHMVKEGLKRRKEAAIMMAQGPQPFIRKYVPRPDTPEGLKLDGFILLEAGDEELPEMIVAARLPSRNLSSVESADLEYFPALKVLDLGDNRIPDLATLSGLVGLRQLVLASNRLSRLGNMDLSFAFQQLQSLDLSYNKLGPKLVLGEGSPLASLPRLVELDLSGNSMSHLPDALGSFSTLLILKLNENRLSGGDMSPLSNLPALRELSVSKNVITYVLEEVAGPGRFPHLLFLDLTHNRISEEASIGSLSSLPSLRMLLLADNPLSARQHMKKLASREDPEPQKGPQIHFNHVPELPPKATIASILSTTRVKIKEPLDPKAAAKAAAAAAAVAATSDEVLIDAFDRLDTAIDTWQLNTVDEADEDDGAVEPDHTFLTGIGLVEQLEAPLPEPREPSGSKRPTWEDVEDPTERLALALGLNPNLLAVHTGKPTNDSVGSVNALRFALTHPLVEADEGLKAPKHHLVLTAAAKMKRRDQRLLPLEDVPVIPLPPTVKAVRLQTMEGMLQGMKQKLAGLEAALTEKLAAAPAADKRYKTGVSSALQGELGLSSDDESRSAPVSPVGRPPLSVMSRSMRPLEDDARSDMSPLPDDVIDAIENPALSESGESATDNRNDEMEMVGRVSNVGLDEGFGQGHSLTTGGWSNDPNDGEHVDARSMATLGYG